MTSTGEKWGTTSSHRKLDQRLAAIRTRLAASGQGYPGGVDSQIERMRRALDEEGLRKAAETGERAVAIVEKTQAGGPELLGYLRDEFAAGRLDPADMEAYGAAIDHFQWRKERAQKAGRAGVKRFIRVLVAVLMSLLVLSFVFAFFRL